MAWIKYLIKLNYDQQAGSRGRAIHSATSSGSNTPQLGALSVNSPTFPALASTSRPSVAALAAQLVAEQTLANQPPIMLDQDDILDLVEACLTNSGLHVSPLIRSVLNTVIEADADIKEKIGPLLKQIDQRIVSGSTSSIAAAATSTIPTPTPPIVADAGGGVWQEGPALTPSQPPQEQQDEDSTMGQQGTAMEGVESSSNSTLAPPPGAWTFFEEDAWRPCPMGCLPGGVLPDLSFPWSVDPPPIARLEV